jgi:hypothetical protein
VSHTATAAAAPKLYLNGSTVLNEVKKIHLPEFDAVC